MNKKYNLLLLISFISFLTNGYSQTSSVFFYRPKSLFMANTSIRVAVNDTAKFTLENGTYYELKTASSSIDIITSVNTDGIKKLALEKGKNYYIRMEVKGMNSVNLIQETEFTGKPAVERLKTDQEGKEINTSTLKSISVTTVVPLPDSTSDMATIYLFRPFNVLGVNFIAKVSDGTNLYEMKNKSSYVIRTPDKELNLKTVNEGASVSNTSLHLTLQNGKIHYIAVLRNGGAVVLTETKKDYAKQEMKLQ